MLGIALESGGAKGSYHAGVLKATTELGIKPAAVVGTSIGAINGALVAQGDTEKLCDFWLNINFRDLFNPNDTAIVSLINGSISADMLKLLRGNLRSALKNKGIDTSKMYAMIEKLIDADKFYSSPIEYGMVTFAVPEMKPLYVFKEDIPRDKLCKYILASATFPGFQPTDIDGKKYMDGGAYDACPTNMLREKGCDEIIVVRIFGHGIYRVPEDEHGITYIIPSEPLGHILDFSREQAQRNINLGYYDAMRVLRKLAGHKYCIEDYPAGAGFDCFCAIGEQGIKRIAATLRIHSDKTGKRLLFEELIPKLCELMKISPASGYDDILIEALEQRAMRIPLDRFRFYSLSGFLCEVCRDIPNLSKEKATTKRSANPIIDTFLSVLYHAE